jgi:hypothetical protein
VKKYLFLFLSVCLSIFIANSQEISRREAKFSPGIGFSTFGKYDILTLTHLDGSPKYSSHSFYSIGISGFFKTRKLAQIETGFYFSNHIINIQQGFPSSPNYNRQVKIALIEIPLNIRYDLKYFFISSGIMADIEMDNSSTIREQSGLGINTSLGLNYDFKSGISVYAGPIFYLHSILPFEDEKLAGFSLKMGVKFHKLYN